MLHLDLTKALPPRPYLYLSAFLPGLFFELSILLAHPERVCELALRTREAVGLGSYLTVLIGLFFAFVIGNALMLFSSVIQSVVGFLYRYGFSLWELYRKHVLYRFLTWMTHRWKPAPPPTPENPNPVPTPRRAPRWINALYQRTLDKAHGLPSPDEKDEYRWWETFARHLLLKRYDLAEEKFPTASFGPLYDALAVPTHEERRGSILMNATQATGWAGLLVARIELTLWNKWYLAFAAFLIACGLVHDFAIARYLNNPEWGTLLRLQANP